MRQVEMCAGGAGYRSWLAKMVHRGIDAKGLMMIRIYEVTAKDWDKCLPEPHWRESITRMLCKRCKAILPDYIDTDPQMEIVLEGRTPLRAPQSLVGMLREGVPWKLVRRDFAEALRLREQEFQLFPVRLNGALMQDYFCYSQPYKARIFAFTSHVHSAGFCSGCGGAGIGIDYERPPQVWGASLRDPLSNFRNPTLKSQLVFTGEIGWNFYVRQELVESIPPALRDELKIEECRIVEFPSA